MSDDDYPNSANSKLDGSETEHAVIGFVVITLLIGMVVALALAAPCK